MELPSVDVNKVRAVEGKASMENIINRGFVEEQQEDSWSHKIESKDPYEQKLCMEDGGRYIIWRPK